MNQNPNQQRPKIDFEQMSQDGKLELSILTAIQQFLKRVQSITAQEARPFIQCEEYLKIKAEEVLQREAFMFEAKKRAEAKAAEPRPTNVVDIKPATPPVPPEAPKDDDGGALGRS